MEKTLSLTRSALLLSLLIASGFIVIPSPFGVPFTLQTMILLLIGLLLTAKKGTKLVSIYIATGALGFPFFAGGASGLAYIAGPTGGFLLGFLFVPLTISLFCPQKENEKSRLRIGLSCAAGLVPVYAIGILWLITGHNQSLSTAVFAVIPFLPAAIMKVLIATTMFLNMRRLPIK